MQKILFSFIFSFLISCNYSQFSDRPSLIDNNLESTKLESGYGVEINFIISPRLGSFFPKFERLEYSESEIDPLFKKFREDSNQVCKMLYKHTKFDIKKVKEYTNIGFNGPINDSLVNDTVKRIIAGCWNFYQMNDIKPERDFKHFQTIGSGKNKNCFSVGFLQPYMMHTILDCETLTMLDMDWKILDGHSQMLKGFRENQFKDEETGIKFIETLKLSWIVGRKFEANPSVTIEDLCEKNSKKKCITYLVEFQKKFSNLKRINLYLSTIHEANLKPSPDNESVVFVSNAFESYYTKPKEFKYMIDNLKTGLIENDSVYYIYHVGGKSTYGIYEISKKEDKLNYFTHCKDEYVYLSFEKGNGHYQIYLDYLKEMKKSKKTCNGFNIESNIVKKGNEQTSKQ